MPKVHANNQKFFVKYVTFVFRFVYAFPAGKTSHQGCMAVTFRLHQGYAMSQTGTFLSRRGSGNRQHRGVEFYRKTFSMSQRSCEFDF